jgi:hypothetical protein
VYHRTPTHRLNGYAKPTQVNTTVEIVMRCVNDSPFYLYAGIYWTVRFFGGAGIFPLIWCPVVPKYAR